MVVCYCNTLWPLMQYVPNSFEAVQTEWVSGWMLQAISWKKNDQLSPRENALSARF